MIPTLISSYKSSLEFFFNHVEIKPVEQLLDLLLTLKGTLFFTGVGKSAIVADKLAKTFISTGTKALYLSAVDALHGDIGLVDQGDLLILISKSGQTQELLTLLPVVRRRGVFTVAWSCNEDSRLFKGCDLPLLLPFDQEICPFQLAPTSSTTAQLILGDVLAMGLMQRKGVTLEQYAANHPAGRIGERADLRVEDLMVRAPHLPLCLEEARIGGILPELTERGYGCILVVDRDDRLQGIFTDGDLRRALHKEQEEDVLNRSVGELMTRHCEVASEEDRALNVLLKMENGDKKVSVMPVLKRRKPVGLIHIHHLVEATIV